jgi:hypothetical protein
MIPKKKNKPGAPEDFVELLKKEEMGKPVSMTQKDVEMANPKMPEEPEMPEAPKFDLEAFAKSEGVSFKALQEFLQSQKQTGIPTMPKPTPLEVAEGSVDMEKIEQDIEDEELEMQQPKKLTFEGVEDFEPIVEKVIETNVGDELEYQIINQNGKPGAVLYGANEQLFWLDDYEQGYNVNGLTFNFADDGTLFFNAEPGMTPEEVAAAMEELIENDDYLQTGDPIVAKFNEIENESYYRWNGADGNMLESYEEGITFFVEYNNGDWLMSAYVGEEQIFKERYADVPSVGDVDYTVEEVKTNILGLILENVEISSQYEFEEEYSPKIGTIFVTGGINNRGDYLSLLNKNGSLSLGLFNASGDYLNSSDVDVEDLAVPGVIDQYIDELISDTDYTEEEDDEN